jgi:putative transposase
VQQRKGTFRMYPNSTERALLDQSTALHCRVTNTLLEEHRRRYAAGEPAFNFVAMCQEITKWRGYAPSLEQLNAQSLQVTAKRVAKSFDAFFRRVKAGEAAGYPRFKSFKRFSGFGFKTHGDGWKLLQEKTALKRKADGAAPRWTSYGAVRLSGIGTISIRGRMRFAGVPKTAEILKRGDTYYLSVTFNVENEALTRVSGSECQAFDWGLETLLTQVVGDAMTGSVEKVENPRWLKAQLTKIKEIQRAVSALEARAKLASGKERGFPVSAALKKQYARLRTVHSRIARQRQDFYHKLTAALVKRFGWIVTEELSVKNMSRAPKPRKNEDGSYAPNGAAAKAGLNRSIHDAAPTSLMDKLRYKAAEAGSKLDLIPTRKLKPTQRCHCCGKTTKLDLKVRNWRCSCGAIHQRDENAARSMLRYAYEGDSWFDGAGTGPGLVTRLAA